MSRRVNVTTADGVHSYFVYNDNRELAADYDAGLLRNDEDILYRGFVCGILNAFTDADGCRYTELLLKGGIGPVIQIEMM